MIRYLIKITGKVQGVGFRQFTLESALRMGVKGIVRNTDDGAVYCEAEGGEKVLQLFMDQLAIGPSHAKVNQVDVTMEFPKPYSSFEIV
jgi:acylphosphatase